MIRQAKRTDYEAIMANEKLLELDVTRISDKEYRILKQKRGFLIPERPTKEAFEKELENIYLVYEDGHGIIGHVRIDAQIERVSIRESHWLNEELMHAYFNEEHAYLGRVAVHPDHRHKGIAHQLVAEAEKQLLEQGIHYLYLFIVMSPLTNLASIIFHEQNDFIRIDVATPFAFAGMEHYQSFMYGKKLK